MNTLTKHFIQPTPITDSFYGDVQHKFESRDLALNPKDFQNIHTAYELCRTMFWDKLRDDGQTYFVHLENTARIILDVFPNPTPDKLVIALLHDIIEDSDITHETLSIIFGRTIASKVKSLSKVPIENYIQELPEDLLEIYYDTKDLSTLTSGEQMQRRMVQVKLKMLRNQEYFEHLSNLEDIELDVKFADRIDNLRSLCLYPSEKIIAKLQETLKYFLPLARERNPIAFEMLQEEVKKIQSYLQRLKITHFEKRVQEILEKHG